ncbi:MAG: condensation domain-containing protein [Cyanobacteria bacterium P01_F01_bin.3]
MDSNAHANFRRKIVGERVMLMLPFNVVFVGRVRGTVDPSEVATALERLRSRHPLLAVRAQIEDDGTGAFLGQGVPPIQVHMEHRKSSDQWLACIKDELSTPFPMETGPLVRAKLIHSESTCEIILCGHHVICDGMSLGYLLRDLLGCLAEPKKKLTGPVIPPPIDHSTVAKPPSIPALQRFIMGLINKKWAASGLRFSWSDMHRLHEEFWRRNTGMQVLAWAMEPGDTASLVERSRAEQVTVNSALWTAFLAAQYDSQVDRRQYRQRSALAVNTREKLRISAGESFGFYASSLTVKLPYSPRRSFWDNARKVHSRISKELARTNLFRMLSSEQIHPTLLDALYFQKYGLLDDAIPGQFLRKMGWHQITYGYALTNVGRFDIPTSYGPLKLEGVYGPLFYSDVEEKMVGVITVGGRLSFLHASRETVVGDATCLQQAAMRHLETAIG